MDQYLKLILYVRGLSVYFGSCQYGGACEGRYERVEATGDSNAALSGLDNLTFGTLGWLVWASIPTFHWHKC